MAPTASGLASTPSSTSHEDLTLPISGAATDTSLLTSNSSLLQKVHDLGLHVSEDQVVDWQHGSSRHPRNWSLSTKLFLTACIFLFDSFSALLESAGLVPATPAAIEYGVSQTEALLAYSLIYGIGEALGSLVFPPYSEAFGRKPTFLCAAACVPISCLIVGLIPHISGAYIGRFMMGAAASVPATINVGSLEDIWQPEHQGVAIYSWVLSAGIGVGLGPIYAAYTIKAVGWRWLFYISAMISFGIFILLLLTMRETRPSKIINNHLTTLQPHAGPLQLRTSTIDDHVPNFRAFCQSAIIQPARLFFSEPIIFTMATLAAVAFSLVFLFTEALELVFAPFGFTETSYTLAFVAYLVGMLFGIPVRWLEARKLRGLAEKKGMLEPEDRITGFATGASALAVGLWILAWSTPPLVRGSHWIIPMVGVAGTGFAANEIEYALGNYLTDTYTVYASSAFAAYSTLRALLSGAFPLFADQMYSALGANIAGSILAAVATLWLVSPVIFMKYGKVLREKGNFAKFSVEGERRAGDGIEVEASA